MPTNLATQPDDDLEIWLALSVDHARAKKLKRKKMTESQAIVRSEPENLAAAVVVKGDLSGLNEGQLRTYYTELCASLGLNPLTRPFSLLTLNGKKMLYANKDCSDQLRSKHAVSIRIVSRERMDDMIVVTSQATLPSGRVDESIGAVPCGANVKGENLANAMMKCETKAKRRVTLSICGLGFMDESEVDSAIATSNSGQREEPLRLSPHVAPDEDPDALPADGGALGEQLGGILETVKADLATCDSYDKALALRAILGSKAKMSDLTKRIQAGSECGDISPQQRAELGKLWQHCDRQVTKLEKQLAPGPEDIAHEDPEPGSNG